MNNDNEAETLDALARCLSATFSRGAGVTDYGPTPYDYTLAEAALACVQPRLDFISVLNRFFKINVEKFGPGERLAGTLDHIKKELIEVEDDPHAAEEWIDVALLALQGAFRHGHDAEAVAGTFIRKIAKIEARTYPDWRTADPDKAIEHIRE